MKLEAIQKTDGTIILNKSCILCGNEFQTTLLDNICTKCQKKVHEMELKTKILSCGHYIDSNEDESLHICKPGNIICKENGCGWYERAD